VSEPPRVPTEVVQALDEADLIADRDAVEAAVDQVAIRLRVGYQDAYPVLLCIMNGGLVMTAKLLERLDFPLQLDYVQVARYGDATRGGELNWRVEPTLPLVGRTVVIVDDILDRGHTLAEVVRRVRELGASEVVSVVLVDKAVPMARPIEADHAALAAPDRYLFGCGMDYRGHWRNLSAIYALPRHLDTADP
jgi:hypoxanthine phosphoribosyltransferase